MLTVSITFKMCCLLLDVQRFMHLVSIVFVLRKFTFFAQMILDSPFFSSIQLLCFVNFGRMKKEFYCMSFSCIVI